MESKNVFVKTLNVINSCETKEHLVIAWRYFWLARERLGKDNARALKVRLEMKDYKLN